MKILFLAHSFPYPPDEGIKLMSYNLLKEFAKRHSITLVSLIESEEEKKYIPAVKKFCQQIETVLHKVPKSFFKRLWNIFFQREPFSAYQFYSKEFAQKLPKLVKNGNFDIIHFDYLTSVYRSSANNLPGVFFPHDALSMLFKRNIKGEKNIFRKFYISTQWKKMVSYEKETLPKFEKTVVVSPKDKEWLFNLSLNFNPDISVIPNGVDTDYFKPLGLEEDYPSVIFRGIMNFLPNIDAAVYFAKEILPFIRREVPHLKYYIVGPNPTKEIKKLASDPLNLVTGYVEDIRLYISRAIVNVCPMRIGSGIKNKILEAMAMSKPTVATKLACEGIPEVKDGENILIADTPGEFAGKVIFLLKDEKLRKKIGEQGRKFVMENYTWQKTAEKFEKLYEEAIEKHKALNLPAEACRRQSGFGTPAT